ncbi:trigger factor [Candidatus Peregrinibacteria bacterium]|nr:trigger factor [Candidatus Peregrinibacteria bacterium]
MPDISPPKKLKQSRVECTVAFTGEEVASAEQKALLRLGGNMRIEGFRPGKAPTALVRQKIDPSYLNEETVRLLLPAVFDAILKEHNLRPIIPPKVDIISRAPLTMTITLVEKPDVRVKGAGKIRVIRKDIVVEKKDVARMTGYLRDQYRTAIPVERPAKDGDELTLDFAGTLDGKEAEGTRATGYKLTIGSKSLIPGFEEALIGMNQGERKSFPLTFPADYHAEHLRGKEVTFTAIVNDINEVRMPDFTDAFVKEHHMGESVSDLEKKIEQTLLDQRKRDDKVRRREELLDAIRSAAAVDLAPELIAHEERMLFDEIVRNLEAEKAGMDDWLRRTNRTAEKLKEELLEEAVKRLTLRFAIQWLLEENKIEATPQELDEAREIALADVEPSERGKAESHYKKGGEGYEELKWRKRVDKLVEEMLAA